MPTCLAVQERSAQNQWNAALVTVREIVGLWGVGTSFIITGQLIILKHPTAYRAVSTGPTQLKADASADHPEASNSISCCEHWPHRAEG